LQIATIQSIFNWQAFTSAENMFCLLFRLKIQPLLLSAKTSSALTVELQLTGCNRNALLVWALSYKPSLENTQADCSPLHENLAAADRNKSFSQSLWW